MTLGLKSLLWSECVIKKKNKKSRKQKKNKKKTSVIVLKSICLHTPLLARLMLVLSIKHTRFVNHNEYRSRTVSSHQTICTHKHTILCQIVALPPPSSVFEEDGHWRRRDGLMSTGVDN